MRWSAANNQPDQQASSWPANERPQWIGPAPKLDLRKPGHYLNDTTNLLTNVFPPGYDEPGVPMFTFGNTGRKSFRALSARVGRGAANAPQSLLKSGMP